MSELRYRINGSPDTLEPGECVVRGARAAGEPHKRWWMLWFRVIRESDGLAETNAVPVHPHGDFTEYGVGGRTWGLKLKAPGTWQVSPSIHVLEPDPREPGKSRTAWHQTPVIVDVPDGEPWQ